jgi:hypothetical protein
MDTHGATALAKIEERQTGLQPVAATAGMSPVVLAVLAQNPDAATLRECLAIQREYDREDQRRQFVVAFHNLTKDLPRVLAHDKEVSFLTTHFTHTTIGAAVDAVVPHLVNHGFTHSWRPGNTDKGEISVTCRLSHIGGHYEEVTLKSPPDAKLKNAQAVMSTVTSLERYTLLGILGIVTKDMGEARGDEDEKPEPRQAPIDQRPIDDKARNANAVTFLMRKGRTVDEAVKVIGRPVAEWTQADRQKIREWATAKAPAHDSTCPAATGGDLCDCGAAEQPPSE